MANTKDTTPKEARAYFRELAAKVEALQGVASKQAYPLFSQCLLTLEQLGLEDDLRLVAVYNSLKDNPFLEGYPEMLNIPY